MDFLFNTKCPNCGKTVKKSDEKCGYCGISLHGGKVTCSVCGKENPADFKYCSQCRSELANYQSPEIQRYHWARNDDSFAVRIEASDLSGLFRKGIVVEPGTNAMMISGGVNQGVLPPGTWVVETAKQKISGWLNTGIPTSGTVLLVDVVPTEIIFPMDAKFTGDQLPISLSVRIQAEVEDPTKFLINMLKGKGQFTREDLRDYLMPEIAQAVDFWLKQHSLQDIVETPNSRKELDLAMDEALRRTFSQSGLRFLQVRTVELNLEPYDRIKGIRSGNKIKIEEAQAEAEGKRNWNDLKNQENLDELRQMGQAVELEERKSDLYERMRSAVKANKINEIKSEADFEAFLDQQDYAKLLQGKERQDLLQTWAENKEDNQSARSHLMARLDLERDFELRMLGLRMKNDVSLTEVDTENEVHNRRLTNELESRRRSVMEEIKLEDERVQIELRIEEAKWRQQRVIEESSMEDEKKDQQMAMEMRKANVDLELYEEEKRLIIRREDDLERSREKHKQELERLDAETRSYVQRTQLLGSMGTAALITLAGPEQAKILADLSKTDAMKGMTEDQILALAAKDSPEVARAIAEKFRAIADGKASDREKEMFERLLGSQKDMMDLLIKEGDKRMEGITNAYGQSLDSVNRAGDRLADTAKAFAEGKGGQPIIVTPGGGVTNLNPANNGSEGNSAREKPEMKDCPNCGIPVDITFKSCPHCQFVFPGM